MEIRWIEAIDCHSHFDHGAVHDRNPEEQELQLCTLPALRKQYQRAGIQKVAFSSFASVLSPEEVAEENELLFALSQEEDWIYQWVVIDPRGPETFRQADRMLSSPKCLGIKIHPSCHGYDIMEYGDRIFEYANVKKAAVLMHPQHVEKMPSFADRYPEMKLIIAHLGSMAHISAIRRAKHGNIYTDTSGKNSYLNNVVEKAVVEAGSEHILFGTDTYSAAFQYGRILFAGISQQDKENILFRNALRLFPKLADSNDIL